MHGCILILRARHQALHVHAGCAGLQPTVAAIKAKKDICLANKETLIAGGPYVLPLAKEYGVNILPADSEHSVSIYQPTHSYQAASHQRCNFLPHRRWSVYPVGGQGVGHHSICLVDIELSLST